MSAQPRGRTVHEGTVHEGDVLRAILAHAESIPEAPALWDGIGRSLTYGQLGGRIRAMAGGLVRHGFRAGDGLRIVARPSIPAVTLALAAVLAGGDAVINLDDRDVPALQSLVSAQADWTAAESLYFVSGGEAPSGMRLIHLGAWLPGVPRTAVSLRRLAAAPLLTDDLCPANAGRVIAVTSAGSVSHSRADLASSIPWLATELGLAESDVVLTTQLTVGLTTLYSGARWRIGSFATGRRDLSQSTVLTVCPDLLAEAVAALRESPDVRLVVQDGPLGRELLISSQAPLHRLVVLSGREGLLPIAVTHGDALSAYLGPGQLLGAVVPGVRVLVDGDRILTSGVRDLADGPTVVDSGLRGAFAGRLLVAAAG